jgi:uncharacterized protein (TIGR01777 family)
MNVLLTGATGFIGARLAHRLESAGHRVLPVSRRAGAAYDWSEVNLKRGVDEADAIINLAGENLFAKRWTARQKELLRSSRIEGTRKLAALAAKRKLSCFISASAIGYYGSSTDRIFDESAAPGEGFLSSLCVDWEAATAAAAAAGVRTAIVRTGVVLGEGGGALSNMLPFFKLGIGGPLGNGRQWVSWVHIDDVIALFLFLLENAAHGTFNAASPQPVQMKEFARALGRALHRPAIFPVPAPMLRIALGEVAEVLLTGQRVEPRRTREAGFRFAFTDINAAFANIVSEGESSTHKRSA